MLKVFVTGFDQPYSVCGDLVKEDEKFLILLDGGVHKRIPQSRIVYVEETDSDPRVIQSSLPQQVPVFQNVASEPVVAPAPQPQEVQRAKSPKASMAQEVRDSLKKAIEKKMAERADQNTIRPTQVDPEPEPPPFDVNERIVANVVFTGAKQASFELEVPKDALNGRYTPALGREIFSYPETKNILAAGDVVLDGVPTIDGDTVTYSTKVIGRKELGVEEKIKVAGEMISMGSKLTDFAKGNVKTDVLTSTSNFSMSASPFTRPATLSLTDDEE